MDDAIAQMYERAIERMGQAGLEQYEISNFCRPGFASRHNLRYWERRPYLGVGLDASSALHAVDSALPQFVLRSTTTDELSAFLEGRSRRRQRGSLRRGSMRRRGSWGCG